MVRFSDIARESADAVKAGEVKEAQNNDPRGPSSPQPPHSPFPTTGGGQMAGSGEADEYFYKLPGYLDDFKDFPALKAKWSGIVNGAIDTIIHKKEQAGKQVHFYNAAREKNTPSEEVFVKWRAFPRNLDNKGQKKWSLADQREYQDEYCEWEVKRERGELKSVTFTTEFPEYFRRFLSSIDNGERLLSLYNNRLISDPEKTVTRKDLFDEVDRYNPKNRWNTRSQGDSQETEGCIAHMIRANNTLLEAADLVADSTIVFERDGEFITEGSELLKAIDETNEEGNKLSAESPHRNSDPHESFLYYSFVSGGVLTNEINSQIASNVNTYARAGKRVTVADPVGVYIHAFDSEKIIAPAGNNVDSMWSYERGSSDRKYCVRAKFTVPGKCLGKLKDSRGASIKYGSQIAQHVWISLYLAVADAKEDGENTGAPESIYTFIEGRHIKPIKVPVSLMNNELRNEWFGAYLAKTKVPALTLKDLMATLRDYTWLAYAADEGIDVKFKQSRKDVRVRLVIICTPEHPTRAGRNKAKTADPDQLVKQAFDVPTLAIVAVGPSEDPNNIHSNKSILQVASFDPDLGWFNFYDRERFGIGDGANKWLYFGSSKDAFTPDTQGLGPFCGHPNGTLVMKESEEPWPHWHTTESHLKLPADHLLSQDPLFRDKRTGWYFDSADLLSNIVAKGTRAWFNKRRYLDFGGLNDPDPVAHRVQQWIAHVCLTTTVAISCSKRTGGDFNIPSGFFFNAAALSLVIDGVQDLEDSIDTVPRARYEEARKKLELVTILKFEAAQNARDVVATESEGQAPWKVIVPSNEDIEGIKQVQMSNLLPPKIIAALLMVDFCNPVYSYRRARIMRYIPSTAIYDPTAKGEDQYQLGKDLVEAIKYAMISLELDPETSPEAEFLKLAAIEDISAEAQAMITSYVENINAKLKSREGILDYMKVAETKRRKFRPHKRTQKPSHPLAEFDMSLPYAAKLGLDEGDNWIMRPDGRAEEEGLLQNYWHPRNTQNHFSASGCPFSAAF